MAKGVQSLSSSFLLSSVQNQPLDVNKLSSQPLVLNVREEPIQIQPSDQTHVQIQPLDSSVLNSQPQLSSANKETDGSKAVAKVPVKPATSEILVAIPSVCQQSVCAVTDVGSNADSGLLVLGHDCLPRSTPKSSNRPSDSSYVKSLGNLGFEFFKGPNPGIQLAGLQPLRGLDQADSVGEPGPSTAAGQNPNLQSVGLNMQADWTRKLMWTVGSSSRGFLLMRMRKILILTPLVISIIIIVMGIFRRTAIGFARIPRPPNF